MSLPYPPPYQDITTLSEHICAAETTIENWVRLGGFGHGARSKATLPQINNSLQHHPTN